MRVTLGGAEVDLLHRDEVLAEVLHHLEADGERAGPSLSLTFAGLEHLHHFGVDAGRAGTFDAGRDRVEWRVLPASAPLTRSAKRLTSVWWERHTPAELVPELLRATIRARARVGVLGGSHAQLRSLSTLLADRYPDLDLVGTWSPSRDDIDDPARASRIAGAVAEAGVDLLLVAFGKPRQELWLAANAAQTGAKVAVAVGSPAELLEAVGATRPATSAAGEELQALVHEPGGWISRVLRTPANLLRLRSQSPSQQVRAEQRRAARSAPLVASPARWRARTARTFVVLDAVGIGAASAAAYVLRARLAEVEGFAPFQSEVPIALAVLPLWLVLLYGLGAYEPQHLNEGGAAFRRFALGTIGGVVALGFVSFLFNLQLSRVYVATLFVLALLWGTATRVATRRWLLAQRRAGRYTQNVLVVGADEEAFEVADAMRRDETAGYRVVGFVDDDQPVGEPVLGELRVLGRPDNILDLAYDHRAGLVLVSPTGVRPGLLRDLTLSLEGSAIDVAVAPSLFQTVSRRVTVESVGNVPILHVDQIRLTGARAALKRTVDVLGSVGLLVVFGAPMLLAAVAVRLRSPGPVLFRQERVGRDGTPFTMLKFRTMTVDAEQRLDQVAELNEAGHRFFKVREDPRVTSVGRFLRKWSLDETPQLWNVLRGDMSLVGPRPPLPREVDKYEPWHLRRLRVRPGLTGVWQVSGRANVPFDEAVRMDLFYIENWSLGWDLALLWRTVGAVLGREGAY